MARQKKRDLFSIFMNAREIKGTTTFVYMYVAFGIRKWTYFFLICSAIKEKEKDTVIQENSSESNKYYW